MVALPYPEAELEARTLIFNPPLSDNEFEKLCLGDDFFQFERISDGTIRRCPPEGLLTSSANCEISCQLYDWWHTHELGGALGSHVGFFLPDGSMLSPDAAYMLPQQLRGFTKADLAGFLRLCPAFVIELLPAAESLAERCRKMEAWIANGAQLAWLVDPYRKSVLVYQPGAPSKTVDAPEIRGSGPVEGFTLDLTEVWRCYDV